MEPSALSAARAGDEKAFGALVEPHRRELTVHCYRMLGSLSDAEDALQETLLRAWQGLPRFEGRSSLRSWLYTIATHACLDAIERGRTRAPLWGAQPPADPHVPPPAPALDVPWLGPLPEEMVGAIDVGPEARYSAAEGVALALMAALQSLPGRQRAVLVLRDVLGFSAEETAEIVDTTVAAANSALQRARATLEAARPAYGPPPRLTRTQHDAARDLVGRFVRAWEAGDAGAVVALLRDDVVFSMPPMPIWFEGAAAVRAFLESFVFARGVDGRFRCLPATANGCPALGVYERDETGAYRPSALYVLVCDAERIAELHAFLSFDPSLPWARFGLPLSLEGGERL